MPTLRWLEVGGFRAFGREAQRLDFSSNLAIVSGSNSQGKTSLAEAIEFLLTGNTVRRELFSSAKAEFSGCLRNVHLPKETVPYVKACVSTPDGTEHVVERRLVEDYSAQGDCRTELFVDSQRSESLESLGLLMSEPLCAPVLLQHTIRFLLTAAPQARADYFKTVLEVQDLELLRNEVNTLAESIPAGASPLLGVLDRCSARLPLVKDVFEPLRNQETLTGDAVAEALRTAIESVVDLAASESSTAPALPEFAEELRDTFATRLLPAVKSLAEPLARIGCLTESVWKPPAQALALPQLLLAMQKLLDERRHSAFPLASLAPGSVTSTVAIPEFGQLRSLVKLGGTVTTESASLINLYQAVLAVPRIADSTAAVDCPVCLTRDALGPARVAEIVTHVKDSVGWTAAKRNAEKELVLLEQVVEAIRKDLADAPPKAAQWSKTERTSYAEQIENLWPPAVPLYGDYLEALDGLLESSNTASACADQAASAFKCLRSQVTQGATLDVETAVACAEQLRVRADEFRAAVGRCAAVARDLNASLKNAVDVQASVDGWEDLRRLAEAREQLLSVLIEERACSDTRTELRAAVKDIDNAKATVLDARFDGMSEDILRWWGRLRPAERVTFGGVRRRGTGRRFLDLKAALRPTLDSVAGVERDAVGVFSESQLNALGLSAFLSRCCRHKVPFVVLDDPVPSSDPDHEATFADLVVSALLDDGLQVIVCTHHDPLKTLLCAYHQVLPLDLFSIAISDATVGSVVDKISDTCKAMLAAVEPLLTFQDPETRREAARRLRSAAERLCKEVVVRARARAGERCSLTDYSGNNWTLKPLIDEVAPHLKDPSHLGKLSALSRVLNPGAHDAPPPESNNMRVAFGNLKEMTRAYGL